MSDPTASTIDIRSGIHQINRGKPGTTIEFTPPFTGPHQPAVVVTEWRNEPSGSVRLSSIYVMRSDARGFTIGHDVFDKPGFDASSFGWIATSSR
jgi:hypothetical protein